MQLQMRHFIEQEGLAVPGQSLLLACSGGIDSVVLAHLLVSEGYSLGLAHCNFGLRGTESEEDEEFVRQLAVTLDARFYTERFNTKEMAVAEGLSVQMAARELRYQWFKVLMEQHSFNRLVTAHQADDQAETLLLNLVRGTGPKGLRGIVPKRGYLIRPLLFAERTAVAAYAAEQHIAWREDRSNAAITYKRNFIRHQIMPLLRQLNPAAVPVMVQNAARMQAAWPLLQAGLNQAIGTGWITGGGTNNLSVDTPALFSGSAAPLFVLNETLKPYGFSFDTARKIVIKPAAYRKYLNKNFVLNTGPEGLKIAINTASFGLPDGAGDQLSANDAARKGSPSLLAAEVFELPEAPGLYAAFGCHIKISLFPAAGFVPPKLKNTAAFDADTLHFPLQLRPWQAGDWFVPFGFKGRKKLSDFLTDLKLPRSQKEGTLVLTSRNDIIWVVGRRPDNRFRITEATQTVWQAELIDDEVTPEPNF